MHKPRRILGLMAAFAMLTSTLTPVYANEVDLDLSGLLDDEVVLGLSLDDVTKESQGDWWKFEDGTLTLFGQLPYTGWLGYDGLADNAGINRDDVKKVVIQRGTTANTSLEKAFYKFTALESIEGLENLDTSNVTNMSCMFYGCSGLTSLDVSGFNTANVTNMSDMFYECSGLTSLDVSGFNTSNVKNMRYMFYKCTGLTSLDVSNFNTANVTDMSDMFSSCSELTSLDLSNFSTAKMTGSVLMLYKCDKLTSLYLPKGFSIISDFWLPNKSDDYEGWAKAGTNNIISGTAVNAIFTADTAGKYVRISSKWFEFDNGVLTLFGQLPDTDEYNSLADKAGIYSIDSIRKIVIRPGTTAGKSLASALRQFTALESIEGLNNLDTSTVTDMSYMFYYCSGLTSLDVTKFNTANVTDMSDMFWGCSGLTSLDMTKFNTANVTNMSDMFRGCSGLTSLDVTKFNTANVTDMSEMFSGCSGLTSLDVTKFNTANVTDMSYMFYYCSGLTSLDVTKFNTANVTNMSKMFAGCIGLTSLDVSKFNTANVTDMSDMFYHCSGLTSLDVTKFNTANVTDMSDMFSGCSGLTSLDVTKFNTANVTNMADMFFGCSGLKSLDLTKLNTANVTNMAFMFAGCTGLTSMKLPKGFTVTEDMYLPNISDEYKGWAKAGTDKIISGTGYNAVFTADTAGEYIRFKPGTSPVITKIEPGNGKMNVTWNAVTGATQYTVHYKTGSAEKAVKRDASKTGALITGIANGTYDVWVTATVNGKETTQKNTKKAAVKAYYVTCKTQAVESGAIDISWSEFDGATRYRIVCVNKDNTVRDTKTTTNLSFKWAGLKNGETYGFYVQPYVNGVYPTFTRTDANDKKYIVWTCPVNAPMITKLSLGNQKVWLYYESIPRATKYYIYYKQKGDTKDTLAGTTTANKFLVTKLKNNVSTEFYVKALVDGKLTPLKRPATRTTRAGMKPTITVTAGQAALKWSKYTDCKASATKYKIVFVDANYKQIDTRETSNLAFNWKDKRLVKGKKYGFYVVPYVNGEYIPFGLSHAEDKANVVMFTAK